MPLSTVLGAQSLVQPAVCTTATRPASPYTGQAIYDTTVATTLVWSGSAWIASGGKVLQIVQATTTTVLTSTSTSFVSIHSATITPSSTSSKILVIGTNPGQGAAGQNMHSTLFRGTTAGTNLGHATEGMGFYNSGASASGSTQTLIFLDSPSTTSAQTYTLAGRATGGTWYGNIIGFSSMQLIEVSA